MTSEEAKSCIHTIELLRRLAFNVHGVMDVVDAQNCDKIIEMLSKQSASSKQVDYKAQVKILADVLADSPLDLPCNLMWRPSGWCKEHCKDGQDSPDAECWMRYARVMTESKTESDHIAESDKMVKLEKRTITERLIIAESLIDSVIADSDNGQFRDVTKKTDDVPDIRVGKTDFKPGGNLGNLGGNPGIIHCKDCQYRDPEDKKCDHGHGIVWQLPRPDDWFCADGKAK